MKALVMLLSLLASTVVVADGKTFTVGVENLEYTPHYSYEGGEYKGFAADVLKAFAKEKGYTLQFKAYPVARLIGVFVGGEVDFKYPDNANWAADAKQGKSIVYSDAVAQFTDGALVLPDMKGKVQLKALGAPRGFTPWVYMADVSAGKIKLQELDTLDAVIKSVQAKRVDAGYANIDVAAHYMKTVMKTPDALVYDSALPHDNGTYHLSTIKHAAVIAEFNQFLKDKKAVVDGLRSQNGLK
ncbi:transporter substrate-binding domain-containing protein [Permianibacter sp. IMCC34836]|uniref:substrate-binding periplasmic protein n=1 Tax=Permianibacter fluminis TaxID=2738515 RepID=UPI0015518360|nr:transporter substrate-binding domain-containing protein [Permianibacter fluminis]NQD38828.1 transporter substrate-binding domain-containing protein [Permianibacter fluminis]